MPSPSLVVVTTFSFRPFSSVDRSLNMHRPSSRDMAKKKERNMECNFLMFVAIMHVKSKDYCWAHTHILKLKTRKALTRRLEEITKYLMSTHRAEHREEAGRGLENCGKKRKPRDGQLRHENKIKYNNSPRIMNVLCRVYGEILRWTWQDISSRGARMWNS